jgi:acid phosphatase family membrane protein YuiD
MFAIVLFYGFIVIHDALGVRRQAGKHAKALNALFSQLPHMTNGAAGNHAANHDVADNHAADHADMHIANNGATLNHAVGNADAHTANNHTAVDHATDNNTTNNNRIGKHKMSKDKTDNHNVETVFSELIGHTPIQVLCGVILGLVIGFFPAY